MMTGNARRATSAMALERPSRVAPLVALLLTGLATPAGAQQFASDNYWTAPYGTATTILTVGQYYSAFIAVVAVAPRLELNVGATLFRSDASSNTTQYYSTTLYAKYMVFESAAKNGGVSLTAGTGTQPGYLEAGTVTKDFRSYWANAALTLPFFDGIFSWDLLPGVTVNTEYGETNEVAWGFTYATRLAIYKLIPRSAIVAEAFGTAGEAYARPQFRAGVRFESEYVILAASYSAAFDLTRGAGVEVGIMFLSPRFLCFGGCEPEAEDASE